jgi:hypothetical protein
MIKKLKIGENIFSAEDMRLIEKGGYTISEASDSSINDVFLLNLIIFRTAFPSHKTRVKKIIKLLF